MVSTPKDDECVPEKKGINCWFSRLEETISTQAALKTAVEREGSNLDCWCDVHFEISHDRIPVMTAVLPSSSLLLSSLQTSMRLEYEPSSEPLHIFAKSFLTYLFRIARKR